MRKAKIYHVLGIAVFALAAASWRVRDLCGKAETFFDETGDKLAEFSSKLQDEEFLVEHPEAHRVELEVEHA